jgi:hypothetical protein
MAGRPRTMARRVKQLLERHEALIEELNKLMPEQYRPVAGVVWDFDETCIKDILAGLWPHAVFRLRGAHGNLDELASYLEMKAHEADNRAAAAASEDSSDVDDIINGSQ